MGADELAALYPRLVETAFDALVVTSGPNLVYANPAFTNLFGYATDEIIGQPVTNFVAPEEREFVRKNVEHGRDVTYDTVAVHKDGTRVHVEIYARACTYDGAPARLVAIRDVTAAKRATEDLRRSEHRFRELIEGTTDLVSVHRNGIVLYVNPSFVRFLGCKDKSELIGKRLIEYVHPDDRARALARLNAEATEPRPFPPAIFRRVHPDGRVSLVEIATVPIEYDGAPSFLAMGRDVTVRKALEQRVVEAELMASIGVLAAAVNHEISNPLGFLLLSQEALTSELDRIRASLASGETESVLESIDKLTDLARDLREGITRVVTIGRDFKTLTNLRADTLEEVEVNAVIQSAARLARAELRERAELELALGTTRRARANAGRLGQVVLNLLVNAAQAPAGDRARKIRVTSRDAGGHVIIDVEDNGPGVAPELAERVFEPFFTTKSAGEGSGLGLAICHGLVTGFGGTMELAQGELQGALFRVRLDAAAEI